MRCPKCEATELVDLGLGPVEVDSCINCGGTWYDSHELRLLKDRESLGDYRWIDFDLWRQLPGFERRETEFRCPRDGANLYSLRYDESDVVIEACHVCDGIWLDRPEYDRLIRYLDHEVNSRSFADYMGDVREEFVEIFTGKEGIMDEYRDFDRAFYFLQLRFDVQFPGIARIARLVDRAIPG